MVCLLPWLCDGVPDRILDSFVVGEDILADASAISTVPQCRWDELEHAENPDVLRSIANNLRLRYKGISHDPTISCPVISMPEDPSIPIASDPPIWRVRVKVSVERCSYLSCFKSKYRKAVKGTSSLGY